MTTTAKKNQNAALIESAVNRHPQHGSRTIARALYLLHPANWISLNACICQVRYLRGARGTAHRKSVRGRALPATRVTTANRVELPVSRVKPWTPFVIKGPCVVGVLSDVHVPYHEPAALECALQEIDKRRPGVVFLNGDIADCHTISRYQTSPGSRDFPGEIQAVRQFLRHLRQRYPRAKIVYKLGNHEERWFAYLYAKAPELFGMDFSTFGALVQAEDHGVEIVEDQRIVMLGELPLLHGHEMPKGLATPVNPARGVFLRAVDIAMIGHQHRTSEHTETTLLDRFITCWSTGCLCDLHPEYARVNRWNHGAAVVTVDKAGGFSVDNFRIRNGKRL